MSSNRLMYDTCEYKTRLNENLGTLEYMLDNSRYENCGKCRMELGIIGGTAVSNIQGNLVDLETDLFGITRKASLCPANKYSSSCATKNIANCGVNTIVYKDNMGRTQTINTKKSHLPACNMIKYKPIPVQRKPNYRKC